MPISAIKAATCCGNIVSYKYICKTNAIQIEIFKCSAEFNH